MSSLHEPDDQLELYALDRLSDDAMERVEEHILVCAHCRERLDDIGEFAYTMRQSLRATYLGRVPRRLGWFEGWHLKLALAGAVAFALLLSVLTYQNGRQSGLTPVAALSLSAIRGASVSVKPSREYDLTLSDANGERFPMEVVDTAGKVVWSGTARAENGAVRARVVKELATGSYFVRLKSASGELLHEYGLDIRP